MSALIYLWNSLVIILRVEDVERGSDVAQIISRRRVRPIFHKVLNGPVVKLPELRSWNHWYLCFVRSQEETPNVHFTLHKGYIIEGKDKVYFKIKYTIVSKLNICAE